MKNELPTMEKAFNQAHDQSMRKLMDLAASEEKLARLQAEKSKADQKYFAAMKAKDQVVFEVKALKLQNSKSSETIARLHEFEETGKLTIQNLERQIANWENTCDKYKTELSRLTTTNEKLTIEAGATATQLLEVTKQADLREADLCNTIKSKRQATQELAELQAQYDTLKDATPTKSVSQDSDQLQVYRVSMVVHKMIAALTRIREWRCAQYVIHAGRVRPLVVVDISFARSVWTSDLKHDKGVVQVVTKG